MSRFVKSGRGVLAEEVGAYLHPAVLGEELPRVQPVLGDGEERWSTAAALTLLARTLEARTAALEALEDDVVSLAMEVARKIIGAELEARPELVRQAFFEAVESVTGASSVVMKVNPADLELAMAERERLFERLEAEAETSVVVDETIGRGGCVIESDLGSVDARLEPVLEAIESVLRSDDG